MVFILMIFLGSVSYGKTLFLDKYDKGEIFVKEGFVTSISLDESVKTLFLGSSSFKAEITKNKKVIGVWKIGEEKRSNLLILTDKNQYNLRLQKAEKSPLFYFIKIKTRPKTKDIIRESAFKDRDRIDELRVLPKVMSVSLKIFDKEVFKDTLYINIRLKINFSGKTSFKILNEGILLSQKQKLLRQIFQDFDSKRKIISITAEKRFLEEKILVQIPFKEGSKVWMQEIYI